MFMHSFVTGECAKKASMIPQWPGVEILIVLYSFFYVVTIINALVK